MVVRDAHPTDVEAIASMTAVSEAAASRLIQERTVRVHVDEGTSAEIVGFVSFDASERAVQLTHLAGPPEVTAALLEETIQFADRAELPIEMVVPEAEETISQRLEAAGFTPSGDGPRFDGARTTRYRRPVEGGTE